MLKIYLILLVLLDKCDLLSEKCPFWVKTDVIVSIYLYQCTCIIATNRVDYTSVYYMVHSDNNTLHTTPLN